MLRNPVICTLHYFDIGSLGRGEVIRLFLADAGIPFHDIRYPYDDSWAATSARLQKDGVSRTGKVPILEYNGAKLSQHIPILRFLARELNDYDGHTSSEKHIVDAVADIYIDWRVQWVSNLKHATKTYKEEYAPNYYSILSKYYSDHADPFLLGSRITYADFAVYQSIDNDQKLGTLPEDLPEPIVTFKEAFERRPRIQAYLANDRISKV